MITSLSRVVAALLVLAPAAAAAQSPYDVVILNGRVLDGSGNPWFHTDLAISGDRIAAMGQLESAPARVRLDANGLYVAPGFIDAHSHHSEGMVYEELSGGEPLLAQGVTTVIGNVDGGGPLDLVEQRRALEAHGPALNVALLVGHTTVRQAVLGDEDRAPTEEELGRMKGYVRSAMETGSFGLSSALFYAPGSFASTEEVIELARVAAAYGGVYQSHIRDESDFTVGLVAAVDEVIRTAEEAGLPGVVTHIKALGPPVWGYSSVLVERIERARARGIEVFADQYPYLASGPALVGALVPGWAQDGGREALIRRLDDPDEGPRVRAAMAERIESRGGAGRLLIRVYPADPALVGKTLQQVADERGELPVDVAIDLLRVGGAFFASFNMNVKDKKTLMRQPWTMTGSDGELVPPDEAPHPRSYANVTHKLRRYVVEEGTIDLSFAVRSMTGMPAAVYGIEDRGILRQGAFADVVVFDLDRVRDRATYENPHQLSEGVVHLLINGRFAVRDEEITGQRTGRVLSRRSTRPAGESGGTPAGAP